MTTWGWGEGEGFIHFHDNSHREKKCSLASPQGLELNSQGCQSDQEFNTIYSVGSLSGARVSASGWCPEPAQAEQPESWICLACHAVRDSGHMHRETVSPSFMLIKLGSQGSLHYLIKTQMVEHKFQTRNYCDCCRWHSHKPGSWFRLNDCQ